MAIDLHPPRRAVAMLLSALLAAGCATPRPQALPEPQLPQHWPSALAEGAPPARWWSLFGDARLEALVDEALAANADLAIAAERVLQARARAGIADAARYPSLGATAGASRSQSSREGSFPLPQGTPRTQNTYRLGVEASYELDLWGRYAAASRAAQAELLSAEWARRGLRLSLIAEVANAYHALQAAGRSESVLHRTLAGREDALELLGHRLRAGTASEFDLNQTRAEISAVRAQLAAAVRRREELQTTLALLLGRPADQVMAGQLASGQDAFVAPPQVPAGLPSDLLLRRPDLRRAEQAMVAADARIDEARAQLFPSISLTAALGQESTSLSQLFSAGAAVFDLGLALTQPIWNAGRLQSNVELGESLRREAALAYRQAIANAFGDVRRALAARRAAASTLAAESERSAILGDTVRQARLRLDAGLTSRLELLDAERNLLQSELAVVDAEAAQRGALTGLFRALGGGWEDPAGGDPR